jgi:hypothetical protein
MDGDQPKEGVLNADLSFTYKDAQGNDYEAGSPVGEYIIDAVGDVTADNYKLVERVPGTLTVVPKDLTITANDNAIKVGDEPAANGVTYKGFAGDDTEKDLKGTLEYSFTYTKGQPAGTYAIKASGLSSDNYKINYVDGVLTVTDKGVDPPKPEPKPEPKPDPDPIDPTGEVDPVVIAKVEVKGKNLKLSWKEVKGAECFDIYMSKCNANKHIYNLKKIKTVNGKVRSVTIKGINKKLIYKFRVVAKKKKANGKWKVIGKSRVLHIVPSKSNKKYTNQKSLKIKKPKKGKITLKVGKTYRIKATYKKEQKNKKYLDRGHAERLRYTSTNKKVATVSKKGLIRAKKAGTCKIYTQLINGKWKVTEVTVNVTN